MTTSEKDEFIADVMVQIQSGEGKLDLKGLRIWLKCAKDVKKKVLSGILVN